MSPVVAIGLWAALFIGSHLALSWESVRSRLVALVSEQPFRAIYSLAALGTFIPLALVFAHNKHAGSMLWYLRGDAPVRWLAWAMMLAALILLISGLITASPAAIGSRSFGQPVGILKITRHPSFVAFGLFGLAHILMNGWEGDVIFFGVFPALGILGGIHQDRRKLREIGPSYREFIKATSFVPGVALLNGRQQWSLADIPWAAIGIGAAATIVIVLVHPIIFGGSPIG